MAMTMKEFKARALELRSKADAAERELMEFLVWGEQQDFWHDSGYTYLQLLETLAIVKPARYDAFKRQSAQHPEAAAKVSVNALVEAAKFTEPTAQREVLDQARQWEATNETPISPQSAAIIGRDLRSRLAAVTTRNKSYATVVAELEAAQRENAELREEVKNLRAENRALRRAAGPSAKAAAKKTRPRA